MHAHPRRRQLAEISRTARMIENHFLVELFEIRVHAKKRAASRRISIMRSISVGRVVEIETGASRSGHSESAHQRLIAMMTAAQRQSTLVSESGQVVRMRRVHDETDDRTALLVRTKQAHARAIRPSRSSGVSREFGVVLENRRAPNLLDVIDRGSESDRARDVWRAGFESVRRFFVGALFQA